MDNLENNLDLNIFNSISEIISNLPDIISENIEVLFPIGYVRSIEEEIEDSYFGF